MYNENPSYYNVQSKQRISQVGEVKLLSHPEALDVSDQVAVGFSLAFDWLRV